MLYNDLLFMCYVKFKLEFFNILFICNLIFKLEFFYSLLAKLLSNFNYLCSVMYLTLLIANMLKMYNVM